MALQVASSAANRDAPIHIISSDESSDDDLDKPKANPSLQLTNDEDLRDTLSDASSISHKRKRDQVADRVAFDEDEDSDAAYKQFATRKKVQRQKARHETKRYQARRNNTSLVGRRSLKPKNENVLESRLWGQEMDENEVLMETSLPDYLKERHAKWSKRRKDLGDAGLRLPPMDDNIEFSDDENLESLAEKPHLPGLTPQTDYKDLFLRFSGGTIPAPIAQWLRDYQIKGVEFMHKLFVYQRGGILGDDMGLGKTIQVIAFLTAAFGKFGDERDQKRLRKMRRSPGAPWYPRVLLICPGSLIANWQQELDRWGWWHVYVYHGSLQAKEDALSAAKTGRLEIMMTTYSTYRLNDSAINSVRWDCVIVDECHTIKEIGSSITQKMNEVNSLCRIGLTGTAIQNKYEELWTLLNWTNPGEIGPLAAWKTTLCVPMKLGQSHDASIGQIAKARRLAEQLVTKILPIYFLRRTKSLIADQLPKKSDRVVFCPLTDLQSKAYHNFCDEEIIRVIRDHAEPCDCGSGNKQGYCCYQTVEDFGKWQSYVFPALSTLQKLSNHIGLLLPAGESNREKHDKELNKLKMALPDDWERLYRERDSVVSQSNAEFCGKWRVLKDLLKFWHANGDKVLVFSHSVKLLKLLQKLFSLKTVYNVSYLDGSMAYEDRQNTVDEFNSDPQQFVFLISTRAGGVGLNITSANKVVVVDPNWNPAYDLQAQDRAYRIGQTRDVEVFRLVSIGTVEEIVYARQIYKQQQANIGYNASVERRYFRGVQDHKDQKGEIFGLKNLFAPPSNKVRLQDIVNKTNIAESRAGFSIAGLDLESDDIENASLLDSRGIREDDAIARLVADITDDAGEPPSSEQGVTAKRKDDPILAILASAGVQYSHENAEVIGTSTIETRISSRAQKTSDDVDYANELAFAHHSSSQMGSDDRLDTHGDHGSRHDERHFPLRRSFMARDGDHDDLDANSNLHYKYRPPEDVRVRQFRRMAHDAGFEDVTSFALAVEAATQAARRGFLDRWYRQRKKTLTGRHD